MKKDVIYAMKGPFRDELRVMGYKFGEGEKAACIVGAMRGNEIQQMYICSQLIRVLKELESKGAIHSNNEIMVIPTINPYSINIGKRFWPGDETDINRMFPGNKEGETTERVAAGIFEGTKGYSYGIQFASFYRPGDFVPHIRMMETGFQSPSLANLFGLPYVVIRKPKPYDTTTLNYNWQLSETNAFSLYTTETEEIDEQSAKQAVAGVLRFLTRMGIIKYHSHSGYIASVIAEQDLMPISAGKAGIYRRYKHAGDEIARGEVLAEILDPCEGKVLETIMAPIEGVVFFSHKAPLVNQNEIVYEIIKRFHQ
ncbi:MAG: succinylglutamate desuccinylase/aspartoacylase family protein [Lachnospiraceae bacterium]|nr:succinylglutamate desuccinylase/aspartoacylase family protein [Lachnospiraceae bacterium]